MARILSRREVDRLLARTSGRAGGPRLRRLLEREHGTTVTRSQAEELFLQLLGRSHLSSPEVNVRIHGFEVDFHFLWRAQGLVVEIDGYRCHSTRRAFEHNHVKDAALRAAQLKLLRFTYDQLERESHAVVAGVARGLWERAA